jgi:outer membrane protein assembly factor BamB
MRLAHHLATTVTPAVDRQETVLRQPADVPRSTRRLRALSGVARVVLVTGTLLAASASVPASAQWPQWRGSSGDGQLHGFEPPAAWPEQLDRAWDATVGLGHASPVVAGRRIVVHARQQDEEVVAAFDLASGRRLWENRYATPYVMNPAARGHGPGPKSTPAVAGGRVFTLGISGVLSALDLETGRVLWRTPPSDPLPLYGTATSPIVDGARVIAFMGGHDRGALTAFDAASGRVLWRWDDDGPGYATPVVATLSGVRHLVTQSQRRVVGVEAESGRLLWEIPFRTNFDQNAVTPLVAGDLIIYSGLENGTTAIRLAGRGDGLAPERVWHNEQVSMYMSSPVVINGRIYGLSHRNRGQFFALDAATGRTLWVTQGREADNAALVAAGPLLLAGTTDAELIIARPDGAGLGEIRRYTVADAAIWAHLAVADGYLLVKDVDRLIAWRMPGS